MRYTSTRLAVAFTGAFLACNGPPEAPAVSIAPATPTTADTLVVSIDTPALDPDGDEVTYSYAWSRDGEVVAELTGTEVPAEQTAKGQTWSVQVVASDGALSGTDGSASVTVVNAAPSLASATLLPTRPTAADTVTVMLGAASDADGDAVTYTYAWTVNDSPAGTETTLAGGAFGEGDVIGLSVTPTDGNDAGTPVVAAPVTVNTPPSMPVVAISPFVPGDGDDLVCDVSTLATDVDEDPLTYTFAWTIDGTAYTDATTAGTQSTVSGSATSLGETWTCTATVGDGVESTVSDPASVEVWPAMIKWIGEEKFDNAGRSVSSAGDVDGDGRPDLLIGAHFNDDGGTFAGKVYLILGKSLGTKASIDLADADYSFTGEAAYDSAGRSISSAGDVDGDGKDDLLIGAPGNDDGGTFAGKVYLILGKSLGATTNIDLADADYSFVGEAAYDSAGIPISSAGDVDGDGKDDLLIGVSSNADGGRDAGKAYLILGKSLGATTSFDLGDADYSFVGEAAYDIAGWSVSSAGDVDGDGKDDLLIGAPGNADGGSYAGKSYLILGKSLGATTSIDLADADYSFVGEVADEIAGRSISSAGDVDGDGKDDLLIGASEYSGSFYSAGKVCLILGKSLGATTSIDLADADYSFVGEVLGDDAGESVSSAGDVDGDGKDDLLIGAPGNDDGGEEAGKSYLILGKSLGTTTSIDLADADYSFVGKVAGDRAGYSVSSAGDVDGDGKDDLLVGAEKNDDGGTDAGAAYLILSSGMGL